MSGTDPAIAAPQIEDSTMDLQATSPKETSHTGHERTDSGFDDICEAPKARRRTSDSPSGSTRATTPTPVSRKRNPRQLSTTLSSSGVPTSRSSSRKPSLSPDSSRPTSSHGHRSRRSSMSTSARRSSRRSSLLLHQRVSSYNSAQPLLHKDTFAHYIHLHENPFLSQSTDSSIPSTFSPGGTLPRSIQRSNLRSPSLPALPTTFPPRSPSSPSPFQQNGDTRPAAQPRSYSNFVPATTIDWTLPSTRAKEYEEIDRKCRGVRGLWRRLAPRWWDRDKEVGFWDETKGKGDADADGGSVRRYRLDLDGEGGDEDRDGKVEGKRKRWALWRARKRGMDDQE
ncbi:hypothetical protein G7Y79_00025g057520 [Physcia stellaris]|nr:hypothetical protein G7Y79_00025g057520 [Physcia stellaris]